MAIKKMKSIILVTTMVLGLLSLSGCSKKKKQRCRIKNYFNKRSRIKIRR